MPRIRTLADRRASGRGAVRQCAPGARQALIEYLVASLSRSPARESAARAELVAVGVDGRVADLIRRRRYRELDPRDAAIAGFVHRLTVDPDSLEIDDIFELREAGLSDHEIVAVRRQVASLTSAPTMSLGERAAARPGGIAATG